MRAERRPWRPALALAALAVAIWFVYGAGYVGYDTLSALRWGEDIAFGRTPRFEGPHAPTPHPLANLLGVLLAPLGAVALLHVTNVIWPLLTALLGGAAFALGRALFSPAVGALFAVIVLTRPFVVEDHLQAFVDIPFLAAVLFAATLEVRRARAGMPVLALLAVAGLIRPEGWALSLCYLVWLLPAQRPAERLRAAAVALSAPVAWALFDLLVTGDPFHSLNRTQGLATRLGRPQGLDTAIDLTPPYVELVLREPVVWAGLAGLVLAVILSYERVLIPVVLLALGLGGFLLLGALDLPVLRRYLFVPVAVLALFAAVALAGWTRLRKARRGRAAWMGVAAGFLVWMAIDVPGTARDVEEVATTMNGRGDAQRAFHRLGTTAPVRGALERCPVAIAPTFRLAQSLALLRTREPDARADPRGPRGDGLWVAPARIEVARLFGISDAHSVARRRGLDEVARNSDWVIYARCPGAGEASGAASLP